MNNLTSFQRKLVYMGGILLLIVPIGKLAIPPETATDGSVVVESGGTLAQLRAKYELGEASYGKVDPASSTMGVLLLGFRGIATSILWNDALEQQRNKDWAGLRATSDSIILLQPHFLKVWSFQGWNLAYNVSAEWDLVPDRYYWVKEGIKFFKRGQERNAKFAETYWYVGDTIGKKVGRSDEWRQFRQYFRNDPDKVHFPNGPDPAVNPEAKDNYLVAQKWFQSANDVLHANPRFAQHVMAEILFVQYPAKAQLEYAAALQKDGIFDEVTRLAWQEGFRQWTEEYGKLKFPYKEGLGMVELEADDEQLAEIRKTDADKPETDRAEYWIGRYQDMTNYRYWRTRAKIESESTMVEAHRDLYEGERLSKAADFTQAAEVLYRGMTKFEEMLNQYPELSEEDLMIEEGMLGQLFWRDCLSVDELEPDETAGYPLQSLWKKNQNRLDTVREEFNRRKRQF